MDTKPLLFGIASVVLLVLVASLLFHATNPHQYAPIIDGPAYLASKSAGTPHPARPASTTAAVLDTRIYYGDEIAAIFDNNEVRANSRFRGKTLFVAGMVESITTDMRDRAHVTLATPYAASDVDCRFIEAQRPAVERLNPGQMVVLSGVCEGKALWSVTFGQCAVEETP